MIKKSKIKLALTFLFATVAAIILVLLFQVKPIWQKNNNIGVLAAEDEDEVMKVVDTNPQKKEAKQTETKTIYEKLSDTVTQQTVTTTKFDSDGDGILDEEDKHPTINDYFIVKDDNLNGIDDKYE